MILKNALTWLGGAFALSQMLRLLVNLVLSRILFPSDFGLMALAISISAWASLVTDFGLRQSVIAEKTPFSNEFLETLWALQALRGGLLFGVLLVVAFFMDRWIQFWDIIPNSTFSDPRTKWFLAGVGLCLFIDGFRTPFEKSAYRAMERKSIAMIEISVQLIAGAVMTVAAVLGVGVWSLLSGMLCAAICTFVLGWQMFHCRPLRMRVCKSQFKKISGYIGWVWLTSTLQGLINNIDKLLVGILATASTLGVYSIAGTIYAVGAVLLGKVVDEVINPFLSNARDIGVADLQKEYASSCKLIARVVMAMSIGLFFCAQWLTELLFDERYVDSGKYLMLMAVGLLSARVNVFSALVFTLNLGLIHLAMTTFRLAVTIGLSIVLYSYFSIFGIALAFGLAPLIVLPLVWFQERKIFKSTEPSIWWVTLAAMILMGMGFKRILSFGPIAF
jgi:O-antigen/teichoic acid export membrane protein